MSHGSAEILAAPAAGEPDAPAAAGADDLTRIAGVGPRIAALLATAGIRTYTDLARAHPAWLRHILDGAGPAFRTHDPTTWGRQAELAEARDWSALQALQRALFRGRRG